MNILGSIGPSTGGPYTINKVGLLKTLQITLVTAIGAGAGYLAVNLVGLDIVQGTDIDTMIVSMVGIPVFEFIRRWATDYTKQ